MATKYGELFSDEYQKSLKEQFCYADTDRSDENSCYEQISKIHAQFYNDFFPF